MGHVRLKQGGGASPDFVTAGAALILTGYIGSDREGEPINGAMPNGSATTPATTKQQSLPSISIDGAGKITASVAATSVSVTPTVSAGYITAGTAGTVTMSANSNTKLMTTQAAKTVTPSTSSQTAVASGVYTTGAITVGAIPNQTAGGTVTLNSSTTSSSRGASKWLTSEFKVQVSLYDGSVS